MPDLLTPAELAAIADREAYAMPSVVYFVNSPDTGFDEYTTLKEALDAAEETISNYRDEAIDGWNEEVTSIRVGIITHDVEQFDVKHRKDCGEDDNWPCPDCDEMCDYRMSSDGNLFALLGIAHADRSALLRHIAALEARPPAPAHCQCAECKSWLDAEKPAPATGVDARLAEAERERDEFRRDLCEIAEGCGVGVPDRTEAKRRIIAIRTERDALAADLAAARKELAGLKGDSNA